MRLILPTSYHPQNGAVRIRAEILGDHFALHIQGAPETIWVEPDRPIEIQVADHNGAILLSVDDYPPPSD